MKFELSFWPKSKLLISRQRQLHTHRVVNYIVHFLYFKRHFLIVDNSSIWIYTYTGRLHLNPKYSGLQAQLSAINGKCISLGLHYMVNRDHSDQSCKFFFFI